MVGESNEKRFVSRGGLKLQAAIDAFRVDVEGKVAADLGSHIGGFVDCLLQNGARKVYAVDTCYGTLAYKLRQDPRVVVMERTNALYVRLPEKVDIVTIDVGWTPQRIILPRARRLIKPSGCIISLLKPQYEARDEERVKGVVKPELVEGVVERVKDQLVQLGIEIRGIIESPIAGGAGNREFFLLI